MIFWLTYIRYFYVKISMIYIFFLCLPVSECVLYFRAHRSYLYQNKIITKMTFRFLGETQRIAFRLMLSSCVYVCVCVCVSVCVCMPHLWTSGKRFEIETPFLFLIARNDTEHNL